MLEVREKDGVTCPHTLYMVHAWYVQKINGKEVHMSMYVCTYPGRGGMMGAGMWEEEEKGGDKPEGLRQGNLMHNIPQTWLPQKPAPSAAGTGCRMLQRTRRLHLLQSGTVLPDVQPQNWDQFSLILSGQNQSLFVWLQSLNNNFAEW